MDGEDSSKFSAEETSVRILKGVRPGQSVRPTGHDIVKGATVMRAGEVVQAAEVGRWKGVNGWEGGGKGAFRLAPLLYTGLRAWAWLFSALLFQEFLRYSPVVLGTISCEAGRCKLIQYCCTLATVIGEGGCTPGVWRNYLYFGVARTWLAVPLSKS